jgi:hypothetical protein
MSAALRGGLIEGRKRTEPTRGARCRPSSRGVGGVTESASKDLLCSLCVLCGFFFVRGQGCRLKVFAPGWVPEMNASRIEPGASDDSTDPFP